MMLPLGAIALLLTGMWGAMRRDAHLVSRWGPPITEAEYAEAHEVGAVSRLQGRYSTAGLDERRTILSQLVFSDETSGLKFVESMAVEASDPQERFLAICALGNSKRGSSISALITVVLVDDADHGRRSAALLETMVASEAPSCASRWEEATAREQARDYWRAWWAENSGHVWWDADTKKFRLQNGK